MNLRRILGAAALLAIVSLVVVLLRHDDVVEPAHSPASQKAPGSISARQEMAVPTSTNPLPNGLKIPTRDQVEGQPALVAPQPGDLVTTDTPSLGDRLGAPESPPEQEAMIVLDLLKLYRRLFGAYPAGENNQQFVNALLGANKGKVPLLALDHPRLNANGELTDSWGTPFFFHQNSSNSVEVRSAGADRLMYTDDDIVAGKRPSRPGPTDVAEVSSAN